jgi:protein TonB
MSFSLDATSGPLAMASRSAQQARVRRRSVLGAACLQAALLLALAGRAHLPLLLAQTEPVAFELTIADPTPTQPPPAQPLAPSAEVAPADPPPPIPAEPPPLAESTPPAPPPEAIAPPARPAARAVSRPSAPKHPPTVAHAPSPLPTRPVPPTAAPAAPSGTTGAQAPSVQQAQDTLQGRIHEAIQAAMRYPAAARMMHMTGQARVAFDYRDGALVGAVQIAQSSGAAILDAAAMAAVQEAHYPKPPPELENRRLQLLVWVQFRLG